MAFFDDDSKLARKVQKGDRTAFEALLEKYQRPIYSFTWHFFRDAAVCEDLTQETFLRAFRFIDSYRPGEKWSTWLFSIARNLCIDELRRMQKGGTVALDEIDPESIASDGPTGDSPLSAAATAEEGEILRELIADLPEKYRTCIVLFYFNELSYEEIAAVMNISLSNTKILLFRGKKMLLAMYRRRTGSKGATRG